MNTSLYIHIPWCIRKCPYCDFNSHKSPEQIPEEAYIKALVHDLQHDLEYFPAREISSIFIGGGTPSLFSAKAYAQLFAKIQALLPFHKDIEITLEANPGTVEQKRFLDYRALGINRLSLGIQSFNQEHLKKLGRIHDAKQAKSAILQARKAGFHNINLDLMHGLPKQTVAEGLDDLKTAVSFEVEHISWYQLSIEPNTIFYKQQPVLPREEVQEALEQEGLELLSEYGFARYEISAFCRNDKLAKHNLNYWLFGDYYGIGAGAHGKLSKDLSQHEIVRTRKHRQPKDYMNADKQYLAEMKQVSKEALIFEFMLNTTRLEQKISYALIEERTGLENNCVQVALETAQKKGLLNLYPEYWQITALGRRFTNDLQALFL